MLRMEAILEGRLNGGDFIDYYDSGGALDFGSYCFVCKINGLNHFVNFNWFCGSASVLDDGTLFLEEGASETSMFAEDDELNDVYDLEYQFHGFSRKDLTAKVLAATTEIREFNIDYDAVDRIDNLSNEDYIKILSCKFIDETGEYEVSEKVLDNFNNSGDTLGFLYK